MAFLYDAKVRSFRLCREKWVWTNVFYFIPLKTNKIRAHIVLFPRADVDRSNDIPIESNLLSLLRNTRVVYFQMLVMKFPYEVPILLFAKP